MHFDALQDECARSVPLMSQVMNHKDSSEYPVSILYPTDPVWVIHGHARWAGLGADVA